MPVAPWPAAALRPLRWRAGSGCWAAWLARHPGCVGGLRHARLHRHGPGGRSRLTLRRRGLAGRHSGLAGGGGRLGRHARLLLHAGHGRRARLHALGRSLRGIPGPPWLRRLLFRWRHAGRAGGAGRLLGAGLSVHGRLRGALVLGDDGRGVDLGRCWARPGGQCLLMAKRADRCVTVGQCPARIGPGALALVIVERLRAHHQVHVRPQVCLTDLDDFVAFLPEGAGDGPVAVHRDVDQGDPEAKILDVRDDLRQVLLGADHERILQGPVTRQGGQVTVDLALHALAAARPHPAQPQLHPGKVGERVMLGRAAALHGRLVPVAAQQRQPRPVTRHTPQELEQARIVPGDGLPVTSSVDGHRAIGQHVARVHEQRTPIHAAPSSLDARRWSSETLPARSRRRAGLSQIVGNPHSSGTQLLAEGIVTVAGRPA